MRSVVLAAVVFVACASAQQAPEAADLRLDGTVIDADTGQPLANARVQIFANRKQPARGVPEAVASSDKDGSFHLPLKSGSTYSITVTSNGYLSGRSRTETQCSPCTITISLHAQSKFSGRVVAADSQEPIARVLVEALSLNGATGTVASNPADSAVTDRDGEFLLSRLIPGQYFFRFTPSEGPDTLILADTSDSAPRRYLRQWWPGGDGYKKATPFTVAPGTDFRLPDLRLPAEARFQVSGTVRPDTCDAGDAYTVAIGKRRGAGVEPFRSMVVRCGAEFIFADLIPGGYQISLLRNDHMDAEARVDLVVTDRNLEKDLMPKRY